jgi:hypothetical protein
MNDRIKEGMVGACARLRKKGKYIQDLNKETLRKRST